MVGAGHQELYDIGDGRGLQPHYHVPLRAVLDATKNRRMLSMSQNLGADDDVPELEFGEYPEDVEPEETRGPRDLGRFICTEIYVWRVRGFDADYFLVGRSARSMNRRGGSPCRHSRDTHATLHPKFVIQKRGLKHE
jgi:hypothetical protein